MNNVSLYDRFNSKWIPEPNSGCWLWTGAINSGNKRKLTNVRPIISCLGKNKEAHRISWMLNKGPIPTGLCVCHTCDVPLCVNPGHLFLGTKAENNRDAKLKSRTSKQPRTQGASHHKAVLTEDKVFQIRSSLLTVSELAKIFGVTKSTICQIISRRSWKLVP